MFVIDALAAGVRGGENGTAEIYRRGTASRATYYTDFEGEGPISTGADVILDANGGAVIYVNELVTVRVVSSLGTTVREFTAGDSASATEVMSQSFTGTDYDTAASAASNPTTLASVLDLWKTNAGAIDWKVLIGGSARTLQSVLSAFDGYIVNVKDTQYGAKGDGTTDDRGAINAAIAAANTAGGGIVFLPEGTYRITNALTLSKTVSLMGAGPNATVIRIDHASNGIMGIAGDTSNYHRHQTISGIRFDAAQTCTGDIFTCTNPFIVVENCIFGDGTFHSGTKVYVSNVATQGNAVFRDCTFIAVSGQTRMVDSTGSVVKMHFYDCTFITASSMVSRAVLVAPVVMMNCRFTNTPATVGTFANVEVWPGGNALIVGNEFTNGGGATVTAIKTTTLSANTFLLEDANHFGSTITRYDYTAAGDEEKIILGSREKYGAQLDDNSATVALATDNFGRILYRRTSGAAVTLNFDGDVPIYGHLTLSIWNDGTGGNVTVTWGTNVQGLAATQVVANNEIMVMQFHALKGQAGATKWYQVGTPVDVTE